MLPLLLSGLALAQDVPGLDPAALSSTLSAWWSLLLTVPGVGAGAGAMWWYMRREVEVAEQRRAEAIAQSREREQAAASARDALAADVHDLRRQVADIDARQRALADSLARVLALPEQVAALRDAVDGERTALATELHRLSTRIDALAGRL